MTESHEAATRILNDYHDRLEKSEREGPLRFAQAFRNGPTGVGVHEKELRPFVRSFRRADGSAIALMLVDRLLRDPKGAIVGIRTVMTEVSA